MNGVSRRWKGRGSKALKGVSLSSQEDFWTPTSSLVTREQRRKDQVCLMSECWWNFCQMLRLLLSLRLSAETVQGDDGEGGVLRRVEKV